jgi:hypothetical protein
VVLGSVGFVLIVPFELADEVGGIRDADEVGEVREADEVGKVSLRALNVEESSLVVLVSEVFVSVVSLNLADEVDDVPLI